MGKHPPPPLAVSSNESPEPLPEPETDHWEKFPQTNCCRQPSPSSPSCCPPALSLLRLLPFPADGRAPQADTPLCVLQTPGVLQEPGGVIAVLIFAVISVPPPHPALQHRKRSRLVLF